MKSSFWFSSPQPPPHYFHASPPTWQVLLLEVPFILLIWKEIVFLWKENYKSAKCSIAFELKRLLVNQRRIHLLTKAENGRNSRPEWLIPRCISTSYHTMVSPKNLSQITALNHEWVMGSWLLIINLNSPPCREVHLTETRTQVFLSYPSRRSPEDHSKSPAWFRCGWDAVDLYLERLVWRF